MGQSLHHAIPDLVEFERPEQLSQERSEGEVFDEIGTFDTGAKAGFETQAIEDTIPIDRAELDAYHREQFLEKTLCLNAVEVAAVLNRWRTETVTEPETEPKTESIDRNAPTTRASKVHTTTAELRTEKVTKSRWPVVGMAIGFAVVGACIFVFA